MALLKVGSKSPVFVTHLEFVGTECQLFCQVGDVGGQADTLAERVAESVENGLACPISQCSVGDLCLALFHDDNSWYRGRVLQNLGHALKVYFIDYGNTETVGMNDIREAPDFVLAIPALSTKCVVCDCTPLSGVWAEEEKKKIKTMLHSGEFTCEIVGTSSSDINNEVYNVKLYNSDAPNTPIFVRPAPSSSQTLNLQQLSAGQEYEVYVSYVESTRKFWVQLKKHEKDLNSLMADIGACFAEDLPSTGDIVNPANGQVCAACFSDDGAFYRGIVKNVQVGLCTVFFVDYGNKEEKCTSELFTLPQALCKLPVQAVPCSYKVESPAIEDKLHKLVEDDGPSILKIMSGSSSSGYVVEINSIEQMLNLSRTPGRPQPAQAKRGVQLWQSYSSVIMQVDGIYDVCLSHVDHPGQFYVQLLGNTDNLDKLMQAIDEVAHNYDKLTNLYQGYQCLAKFGDDSWYRGEVIASQVGKATVAAVDFGFTEMIPPSQLRNTDPNFKLQPAQAVKCSIDLNKVDQSQWKAAEISRFKAIAEKSGLVAKVSAKNGCVHQVDLYETENGVERHLNAELMNLSQAVNDEVQAQSQRRVCTVASPQTVSLPAVVIGSKITLCFTAVKHPYLYGQLTNTPVEKVAKLQTDLNTFFDKNPGEPLLSSAVGSVCCTKYVDGGWYRGMLTLLTGGKAEVAFIDFGDSVMTSLDDLKILPASLCGLPQQCILCKIDNLPAAQTNLEKLLNKRLEVKLTRKEDGVYPTYGAEIADRLVLDQYQDRPPSGEAVFKGASSRSFGRPSRDEAPGPRSMSGKMSSGGSYTQQEVAVNSTQEVMVTYVKDPSSFQVVLEKMNSSLDVVMDQLHEHYDKLLPGGDMLENPKLGQPCVAQFTEDKGWYRAMITGLKCDGQAEVMYVDYGNNEYTDKDALKTIQQPFMSLPAQAVQCCLSGVSSSQGFWSPEHTVQFSEMVEEQSFIATFKAELRDAGQLLYKVELVDKKGANINENYGAMSGTICPEADSGPTYRSVSASKLGQAIKVRVAGRDDDADNKPKSFGGRQSSGASNGFGSKPSAFGPKHDSSDGGDSGWDDNSGFSGASGFGNKKPFGGGGGGFGGSSGSGFGSSSTGGGGFGKTSGFGGGSGASKDCFKCGESGHFSRECSNPPKAGSGGIECYKCGEDGHMARDCTNPPKAGGGRDCFKCGESGHMARDCTNPPKAGFGGGGGRDCYKCGEGGHMARDCTNPPKAGFGGGGGRDCYKCGEGGHMARDCTNPPKAGFGGGGGRDCYKCGEGGHMARDCTNPPKAGFGGGGGRDCYKCGEGGHMARDCTNPPKAGFGGGGGRDCYKCGEGGHMARDCTNPPKEGAGPRRGFGGSGGGDRPSGGGFGAKGGGFGSRGGCSDGGSENWGDGSNKGGSNEGFESRSSGGGGFRNRGGDSGPSSVFGSRGGGFGGKSRGTSGGFGSRGGGSGGFGKISSEDDWGSPDTISTTDSGGFEGGNRSGGDSVEKTPSSSIDNLMGSAGDNPVSRKMNNDVVFSPLTLDMRETVDVYVVYTHNPEKFWCQVMKNCPSLEKLMEEMNLFYNGVPDSELIIEKAVIGMPCAAKFSEDHMWYRAEVLKPFQQEVEVQFVDYGNIETVAADKLRILKPEYMTLKTQGVKCCLDDVVAREKIWSKKATEDFEDMTHDKHLVARVTNRTSDMTHMVDIENDDEKSNIAEALSAKGHCSIRTSKSSPQKELLVKSPYPPIPLQTGEIVDVYVSWIESPEQFWIQPVSYENDLIELVQKIQELYTTGDGVNLKTAFLVSGQAVVAQFSEDEAWYRGYVERISDAKCKVRFADYGNSDLVSKELILLPTDELVKESAQAAMCKLVGVRPLQAGMWTADARDIMDASVKDEVVKCTVVDFSNGYFSVELVSKGVDVRQELIQAAVVRTEKESSPVVNARPSKSSTIILKYIDQLSFTVSMTEAVFISHTDSVASFWCQLARTAAQLEEVMAQLKTHCKSGTNIQDFPMDMACAAKFSIDENWYRAKVTAAYPDCIEVLFVDYGNTEKVPKSDICELTEELMQLPPQAIECELVNSNKASNQLTARFTQLIGEEEVQAAVMDVLDSSTIVSLTLPSGVVVGEELGLSEPGSTPISHAKPSTTTVVQQVKSEPEILSYPKTVMPASSTMVFVTQIINPGEFYIQCADKESQLNELMAKVSEYCKAGAAQKATSIAVGQACLTKFSGDGGWYRAKVIKVDDSNCSVEFVDYGNWEATTSENIRTISPEFVQAAPFVLQCSLEGIAPIEGKWTEDSVKKFEELAVDKDLSCETLQGAEVVLKCGDVDISEALVECGVAKRLEGSKRKSRPVKAKTLLYSKLRPPSEQVDVYVSHVNTPGDFYIQMLNQEDELTELMGKVAGIYESSAQNLKIDSICRGQAVCAQYSEDDTWYRAEVCKVDGTSVSVHFVDYGNSEESTLESLKALKEDLVVAPPYAMKCYLSTVEPVEGDWSEESGVYIETRTSEQILQCQFVADNGVTLKLEGTDVADGLVENGYARKMNEIVPASKQTGKFTVQSIPADSVSCYVAHVDDNGTIYVQLVCEEDNLNSVVEEVQSLETHAPLNIESIKKGEAVCAKFSEDQSWYRAVVISTDDSYVTVRFADYGNCDEVNQSCDLRALSEEQLITPPLAYACRLQGLTALSISQVEQLREVTAEKELTVTFNTISSEYEIHLLDENQQDYVQILAREAGIQVAEVEGETVVIDTQPDETQVELVGNVEAELVAEAGVEVEHEEKEEAVLEEESASAVPDVNLDAIANSVDDLGCETLAIGHRVRVTISHSESPSRLWVQVDSEKEKLNSLLDTMSDFYDACSDSRLTVESVNKDAVVAALCSEDDSWYRAKVMSCNSEEGVKVMFIDHGNTEAIAQGSLRKLPTEFCQLHMQAVECCLGAVEPSQEDWSKEAKEAFTQLTADKVLLLDVGGIDAEGVYKVQLLDMGMSVADRLLNIDVGVQVATPVAVSTNVKLMFSPDDNDKVIARLYGAKPSETIGKYGYSLRDLAMADPTISSHNVLITSIVSPLYFWCRLQDNSYEFYQDKLQQDYSESKEHLTDINKGDKCVLFVDSKEFHRGAVVNKCDENVDVKLVDIGIDVTLNEANVFKLKPEFDKYPQLAFCCSFACMRPVDGDMFTEDACKVFKDTVLELSNKTELPASAKATVVNEENGIILIELTIDRKDISESLVENGVAQFEDSISHKLLEDQDVITDLLENFGDYKNVQLSVDVDHDVVLLECYDMERLIFHSVNSVPILEEIAVSIVATVADKVGGEGIDDFMSGPCLARCPVDNLWYRANLTCIEPQSEGDNSPATYKVFLVDYGSTYCLPKTNILPISDSVVDKPGQAIICRLCEIEPIDGEWTEESIHFVSEHYMVEDVKLGVYVNGFNNGIHEVIVSRRDEHTPLNHLLAEIGLAVPVAGSQMEMLFLDETAETSFHEICMCRGDSYGDDSEFDTSCEPDTSCVIDTSYVTEGDTEADTSCLTAGDASYVTEGDTSYATEGDTEADTSCLAAGDASYATEGDTSYVTEGDTSYVTEGTASKLSEEDTSYETESDLSYLTEVDTSRLTEEDACKVTVGDTSCLTEGDTSYVTEGDTSYVTEGDTSYVTEGDTSYITEGDTSCVTVGDTSCLTEGDTSGLTEGDTNGLTEGDTNGLTEGDTSGLTEGDTSGLTKGAGDKSLNTLEGTHWVCEDCCGDNDVFMAECQHCCMRTDYESVDIRQLVKEEMHKICENIGYGGEELRIRHVVNEDLNGNVLEIPDKCATDDCSDLTDLNKVQKHLNIDDLEEINSSTSDTYPKIIEESDLDLSYRQFDCSPTGYTTSELDTTDLREVDESTGAVDFDVTGLTDYDTTGIEGGGEDLSIYEEKGVDTSFGLEKRKHDFEEETGIKKIKIDSSGSCAEAGVVFSEILIGENKYGDDNKESDISRSKNVTEEMLKEDDIPLFIPVSHPNPVVGTSVLCSKRSDHTFPSVSDTTYPSTLTSVSDFTFTSAYDTSQHDSMLCEECRQDISSCLDTTGCESEFSFYVCAQCQQNKIGDSETANGTGDKVVVEYINHDENVINIIEATNEVFSEVERHEDKDVAKTVEYTLHIEENIGHISAELDNGKIENTSDPAIENIEEMSEVNSKRAVLLNAEAIEYPKKETEVNDSSCIIEADSAIAQDCAPKLKSVTENHIEEGNKQIVSTKISMSSSSKNIAKKPSLFRKFLSLVVHSGSPKKIRQNKTDKAVDVNGDAVNDSLSDGSAAPDYRGTGLGNNVENKDRNDRTRDRDIIDDDVSDNRAVDAVDELSTNEGVRNGNIVKSSEVIYCTNSADVSVNEDLPTHRLESDSIKDTTWLSSENTAGAVMHERYLDDGNKMDILSSCRTCDDPHNDLHEGRVETTHWKIKEGIDATESNIKQLVYEMCTEIITTASNNDESRHDDKCDICSDVKPQVVHNESVSETDQVSMLLEKAEINESAGNCGQDVCSNRERTATVVEVRQPDGKCLHTELSETTDTEIGLSEEESKQVEDGVENNVDVYNGEIVSSVNVVTERNLAKDTSEQLNAEKNQTDEIDNTKEEKDSEIEEIVEVEVVKVEDTVIVINNVENKLEDIENQSFKNENVEVSGNMENNCDELCDKAGNREVEACEAFENTEESCNIENLDDDIGEVLEVCEHPTEELEDNITTIIDCKPGNPVVEDSQHTSELKPDDGVEESELKSDDDGVEESELKPDDVKESELKPDDDGVEESELKSDDGVEESELKPDDVKESELKPDDDGVEESELKPDDDGVEESELKSDDGVEESELKSDDDGVEESELKPDDDNDVKESELMPDVGLGDHGAVVFSKANETSKPKSCENDKPESSDGNNPESSEDDQPEFGEDDQPESGEGDKPESGEGDKPESDESVKPESGESDKPESGEGDKPESDESVKPESDESVKPESGESDKPKSSESDKDDFEDALENDISGCTENVDRTNPVQETKSSAGTETKSSAGTETKSSASTETKSSVGTETKSSVGTETKSSVGTETKSSADTETKSSAGTESESSQDRESSETVDSESFYDVE